MMALSVFSSDFEEQPRQSIRIVPRHSSFAQQRSCYRLGPELANLVGVVRHRYRAFARVTAQHTPRKLLIAEHDVIEEALTPRMLLDGSEMLGGRVVSRFPGLRHQVGNKD